MWTKIKNLVNKPKVKAIIERTWRGGVAGLGAGLSTGAFSINNLVNGEQWNDAWQAFAGGALLALLLSLGVSWRTGTGPALNHAEAIEQ